MVPTVERGLRFVVFWSMDTAGLRPSMKSTSGLSICPRNCRAYADSDSTYLRWPSANSVSNASEDLPEPDSPVNTTMRLRGNSRFTFLRLCSRAPWMTILRSLGRCLRSAMSAPLVGFMGAFLISLVRKASLVSMRSTMTLPFVGFVCLATVVSFVWLWLFLGIRIACFCCGFEQVFYWLASFSCGVVSVVGVLSSSCRDERPLLGSL